MRHLIIFFLGILIFSCQNTEKDIRNKAKASTDSIVSELNLKKDIVGEWETISFKVDVNTFNNTDSNYTVIVGKGEWESKLNMKPIETRFLPNNVYSMHFYSPKDSLVDTKKGLWSVFGDTLLMVEPDATYQYYVKSKSKYLQFEAVLDWDGDGIEDDEYMRIEAQKPPK